MSFKFTKMHALGNNYIYINQIEAQLKEESLTQTAIKLADIRFGIGSDGMILIDQSECADFKMRIFNADGSEAKSCGNGLRCVARYVYDHHMTNKTEFTIETLGGVVEAHLKLNHNGVTQVTVDMGIPKMTKGSLPMLGEEDESTETQTIEIEGESHTFTGVSMGNPHAVFFVEDIQEAPVAQLGPKIEKHPLFPEWINVEFIQMLSPQEMHFRVWERGSGITYACGTGACAATVAAIVKGFALKEKAVTVHLLGGDLIIEWKQNGHVWMTGPAEYICKGVWLS